MDLYTYNPLKDGRAVRFVRILPGACGGVHCQIFRASLTDNVDYIALSYAWGSTARTKSIVCNGKCLRVTESLHSALRRLRLPSEARVFWIDAICINQDDIPERNHQVSLVREVYKKARQLYVWLGPGEKYSNHGCAVDLMRRFAAAKNEGKGCDGEDGVVQRQSPPTLEQWQAFSKLLHRGWFERMWVIQELAMGLKVSGEHSTVFLCAAHRFGLQEMKDACHWSLLLLPTLSSDSLDSALVSDVQSGARRVLVLCDLTHNRISIEADKKQPWRQWLLAKVAATRDKKATDPRDRLFALYGFMHDAGADHVAVADYSKSTEETFHQYARDYVAYCNSVEIFSEVEEPCLRRLKDVPSWVPNWAVMPHRMPLLRMSGSLGGWKQLGSSSSSPNWASGNVTSPIHLLDNGALLIDGVCVDEIASVSGALSLEDLAAVQTGNGGSCALIDLWKDMASQHEPYFTGVPAMDAFYKTLIAGREEKDQLAESFLVFWKSIHCSEGADQSIPTFCFSNAELVALLHKAASLSDLASQLTSMTLEEKAPAAVREARSRLDARLEAASPKPFQDLLRVACLSRVFFITRTGLMGLGVRGTVPGDKVLVPSGSKIPYVIRTENGVVRGVNSPSDWEKQVGSYNSVPASQGSQPGPENESFEGGRRSYFTDEPRQTVIANGRKTPRSPLSPTRSWSMAATLVGEAYVHGIMAGETVNRENVFWERIAIF